MVTGYYGNRDVRGTYYEVKSGHGNWLPGVHTTR